MATTTAERKYALTKIAPGDYLLPSNDGRIVWRIAKYTEGPSSGLDWSRDREVWGVWKWDRAIGFASGYVDTEDWSRWTFHDGLYDTRAEAINAALEFTKT